MVISKRYIASFLILIVLSTAVMYAADDELRSLVVTSKFSEEVPVFHVTKKSENLDVFVQLLLVPPSRCYMDAKLKDDCKDEEAFNGLFYAVACMYADSLINHEDSLVNNKLLTDDFTQEGIEGRDFIASLGKILKSDKVVGDGDKVYGKVINLLLKMKSKKIDAAGLINQNRLRGLRVTLEGLKLFIRYDAGDDFDDLKEPVDKGILLVTSDCDPLVDKGIATILDCHYNSLERAKEGIAALLGELDNVSVNGGYALVNIQKVQSSLKAYGKQQKQPK